MGKDYVEPEPIRYHELVDQVRENVQKYALRALHARDVYNRPAYCSMAAEWAMILSALD